MTDATTILTCAAGQSIGAVARELGLVEQSLRNWVKAAAAGKLHGAGAKVVTPEQLRDAILSALGEAPAPLPPAQ